jgi:CRISPR-associated exonuclease Cas4
MTVDYRPEDLIPLSGIQHFLFCRRQWALIHIEGQWQENKLTVEGKQLHERADDPFFTEKRQGLITVRSVPVASHRLGFSGICDIVEFTASPDGVSLPGRKGTFLPTPIEYKHGKEKFDHSDEAQLCAQAICLEEMLLVPIPFGYLYYGKTHRRLKVDLTGELRAQVSKAAAEMHAYFSRGYTPRVKPSKACRSCSLADVCLPKLQAKTITASSYICSNIEEA